MRSSVSLVAGAIAVMLSSAQSLAQDANTVPLQPPAYPLTLRYGTGLVDIPVAWVSPNNGDLFFGFSGTNIPACGTPCDLSTSQKWNTNFSIETHWIQRFTIGFSLYSNNPEWGFYGQFLALTEKEGSWRPAIAIGFRNLGPYNHEDRLLLGHDVMIDSGGGASGYTPPTYDGFKTAPTFYGVVSKNWKVGSNGEAGATVGYGNGIFSDDGGLGKSYNDKGQIVKGLFLGGRYGFRPNADWTFNFMVENNGWDWNAGAVVDWKGIFLGLYGSELEEGSMSPSKGSLYQVYNYTKFNLNIGFSTNLFLASQGTVLRSQVLSQPTASAVPVETRRTREFDAMSAAGVGLSVGDHGHLDAAFQVRRFHARQPCRPEMVNPCRRCLFPPAGPAERLNRQLLKLPEDERRGLRNRVGARKHHLGQYGTRARQTQNRQLDFWRVGKIFPLDVARIFRAD